MIDDHRDCAQHVASCSDMMRHDELFSRRRRLLEETPDVDGVSNINEQTFGREPEEIDTERATLMQRTLNLFPSFIERETSCLIEALIFSVIFILESGS